MDQLEAIKRKEATYLHPSYPSFPRLTLPNGLPDGFRKGLEYQNWL